MYVHQPDVAALKGRLLADGKTQEEIDRLLHAYFKQK